MLSEGIHVLSSHMILSLQLQSRDRPAHLRSTGVVMVKTSEHVFICQFARQQFCAPRCSVENGF